MVDEEKHKMLSHPFLCSECNKLVPLGVENLKTSVFRGTDLGGYHGEIQGWKAVAAHVVCGLFGLLWSFFWGREGAFWHDFGSVDGVVGRGVQGVAFSAMVTIAFFLKTCGVPGHAVCGIVVGGVRVLCFWQCLFYAASFCEGYLLGPKDSYVPSS